MSDITSFYTPSEAWDELKKKRRLYVRKMSAAWSGDHQELRATARYGSFWKRNGKAKIHVPLAADIAAVSADMLFCERPRFTIFDDNKEKAESVKQNRLDEIIRKNGVFNKLHEAAELASVGGDVFFKINYDQDTRDYPVLMVVSTEDALPEWRLGELQCVHFFTVIKEERDGLRVWRLYERYERGKIFSAVFCGDGASLGPESSGLLDELGLVPELTLPVDVLAAVQVFNMKPSRVRIGADNGRSDFEGQRDQLDALDEVMSSWLRDIRLGKARLLVPAEYLRKKSVGMFSGESKYTWEFDEDVETLVALDIANDKNMAITPSQFEIRAEQHARTAETLIRNIISMAGYSPQSFGLDINGSAESGTALHIREKKSYTTRGKKINYWDAPLEAIMTALLQLDRAIYHTNGIHDADRVQVDFPDVLTSDIATVASAVNMLHTAQAASIETLVKMQHPEWSAKQVQDEVGLVMKEYGVEDPAAIAKMGELE
jgi:hypothetical protein